MIAAGPLETISNSTNISWRDIFLLLGLLGFILIVFNFLFSSKIIVKKLENTVYFISQKKYQLVFYDYFLGYNHGI